MNSLKQCMRSFVRMFLYEHEDINNMEGVIVLKRTMPLKASACLLIYRVPSVKARLLLTNQKINLILILVQIWTNIENKYY